MKTRDGRRLAFEVSGPTDGAPVVLLHGTPGSKIGPKPRPIVLYRLGVQLITYDRPGYGRSDRHERRKVADAALDVEDLLRQLGILRFAVVGRSGGGPHALATAAALGDRVTRAAVLVPLAPPNAPDLDWYAGMTRDNVHTFDSAENSDPAKLVERLRNQAEHTRINPEFMARFLEPQLSQHDARVFFDAQIRELLMRSWEDAVREGPHGWVDDVLALRKEWDVDFSCITALVRLWHGEDDTFSPVAHTRWLERRLVKGGVNVEVQVESEAAHFGAVEILPKTLAWLAEAADADRMAAPAPA